MTSPNEDLVREFFATLSTGDLEALRKLIHPEGSWEVMSTIVPGAGLTSGGDAVIDDFLKPIRGMFEPGDPKIHVKRTFCDGDLVSAETEAIGELANGNHYHNRYCVGHRDQGRQGLPSPRVHGHRLHHERRLARAPGDPAHRLGGRLVGGRSHVGQYRRVSNAVPQASCTGPSGSPVWRDAPRRQAVRSRRPTLDRCPSVHTPAGPVAGCTALRPPDRRARAAGVAPSRRWGRCRRVRSANSPKRCGPSSRPATTCSVHRSPITERACARFADMLIAYYQTRSY